MKQKLEVVDRIQLLGLLPAEGNAITLRVVNELRNALSFGDSEIEDMGLVSDAESGRVTWKSDKAKAKDIEIGETMQGVIKDAFKKLDESGKLNLAILPLYERFMGK